MAPVMLVVDDEADIRSSLRIYLGMHLPGVEVLEASDAEEALGIAHDRRIDLVLTDYLMPGRNGLELLAAMQRLQPYAKRILLTAYPDAGVASEAATRHHALVLPKPADPWRIALEAAHALGVHAAPPWSSEGVPA